ncbi:MAG: MATE family efflux transporter [Eubacteriales bacterium]|nr:MATE family efflux transporter [Eubacteriales bacterium]
MDEEKDSKIKSFAEDRIPPLIIKLAAPMIIAQLVNVLYSLADRVFIAHIPNHSILALSAVGLCFPLITLIFGLTNLLGPGGLTLFSMELGRKKHERAQVILQHAYYLLFYCSIILVIICYSALDPILIFCGARDEALPFARAYMSIYLFGTPALMLSTGLSVYLSAQGRARDAMISIVLAALANIGLDYFFIFILKMGIEGAAIASVISQYGAAIFVVCRLRSQHVGIRLVLRGFHWNLECVRSIISLGSAGFIFQATNALVQTLFNHRLYVYGGDLHISIMNILNTIRALMVTFVSGLTSASHPIISYNYGAGNPERVRKTIRFTFHLSLTFTLVMWIIIQLRPGLFLALFENESSQFLKEGTYAMQIYYSTFFMMSLQFIGQTVFLGLGLAKEAIFFSLLRKIILIIPMTLILPNFIFPQIWGIYWADPVSQVIGSLATFCFMLLRLKQCLAPLDKSPLSRQNLA